MMRITAILTFLLLSSAPFYGQKVEELLIARNTGSDTLWDGKVIRTMGFAKGISDNVYIPGPLLTFTEGDSVEIDLWNISQGAPHTIHLHGLDVDQQNDGVGHLSFYVFHMDHGYYKFKAPHPGTYLYHCHVVSPIHVQGGMYGMIVIKPAGTQQLTWAGGYEYHREHNWLASEVDTNWHKKSVITHYFDTTNTYTLTLPEYRPQYFLVNGFSENELNAPTAILSGKANENIYLRLANIGNLGNRYIFPAGLHANIISSDGRPLPMNEMSDTLEIYPGERYGVLLQPEEQFSDSIHVMFTNLNTGKPANIQSIPVKIQGILGVDENIVAADGLMVYPNPARNEIYLAFEEPFDGNVMIYNSMGLVVLTKKYGSISNAKIELPGEIANGVYFVVATGNYTTLPQKISLAR